MAKAKKLPSGRWRVQVYDYTDENGKIHRKSFTADTKKEAELIALDFQQNGRKKKQSEMTIKDCVLSYTNARQNVLSPKTIYDYRKTVLNCGEKFANKKIISLKQEDFQNFFNEYSKTHNYNSCAKVLRVLKACFRAYDFDIPKINLPQKKKQEIIIPTKEEIENLLQIVAGTDLEIPIMLGAYGGLRAGEICALDYSDFDFENNTVSISKAMVYAGKFLIKSTKTTSSDRVVEIPKFVIDKIKERQREGKPLISYKPNYLSKKLKQTLEKNNLKHFRLHDLRHFNASVMLALGVPDLYAMKRLGHSTPMMLKTVYQHIISDKEKEVNDRINDFFSS